MAVAFASCDEHRDFPDTAMKTCDILCTDGKVVRFEEVKSQNKTPIAVVFYVNQNEDFQGNAVVNYTEREVPYTRIIEHKHFEFGTQPTTVITYEYPDDFAPGKEPYYPINDKRNTEMMSQYKKLASERKDVLFGGRLAQYAYADMDDTVAAALALCKKTFK
jgi:UDP-galactopyranose mutase